jgi:DNA helicase-2/ATP-dependent DNA helicase PcrA
MSIHKSKGLGEDYVFVLGLTDGILPNQKAGIDSIESQRRLFYVAMTRAKKCLCIISILKIPGKYARKMNIEKFSFDKYKKLWNGKASVFVSELKL